VWHDGLVSPRAPESYEHFEQRARRALGAGAAEVRYGLHHFSHALVTEPDATFTVRLLEYTQAEADAYLAEHGMFMPESAESISTARTVIAKARTLDDALAMVKRDWPR
jgi:hypothetical protein